MTIQKLPRTKTKPPKKHTHAQTPNVDPGGVWEVPIAWVSKRPPLRQEQDGMDFAATTVKLPDGHVERTPFSDLERGKKAKWGGEKHFFKK